MKKASAILFITMILSVISACGDMDLTESNSAHQRYNSNVSVWYVDDHSDLWTNFENLSDEYNSTNGKEQSVKISSRSFPDDQSLVHELMDAPKPPSVVLCSGETAAYLDFIGIPHSTNKCFQDWQLAHFDQDYLSSGMNDRGRFSVPISFSPEILFINNQLVDGTESYSPENLSTLEGLNSTSFYYEKETGKPFFTAESFSSIIRTTMASRGEDFHAKRNVDIDSDNFKYAYNILAQIAFHQAQCGPEQYPPQPLASTLAEFGSSFMLAGIVIRNNGKPRILLDLAGIGKPTDITNFREETGNRELTNPFDSEHFLRIRHFGKDAGN